MENIMTLVAPTFSDESGNAFGFKGYAGLTSGELCLAPSDALGDATNGFNVGSDRIRIERNADNQTSSDGHMSHVVFRHRELEHRM